MKRIIAEIAMKQGDTPAPRSEGVLLKLKTAVQDAQTATLDALCHYNLDRCAEMTEREALELRALDDAYRAIEKAARLLQFRFNEVRDAETIAENTRLEAKRAGSRRA